jgi:hypothetical protein
VASLANPGPTSRLFGGKEKVYDLAEFGAEPILELDNSDGSPEDEVHDLAEFDAVPLS